MRLCVLNTFLHVKDTEEEARKLSRSCSDSSLYSSSKSGESDSDVMTPPMDSDSHRSHQSRGIMGSQGKSTECSSASSGGVDGILESPVQTDRSGWSVGSDLHQLGKCNPCAWNWRPSGCINGGDCMFCHMCPSGELKVRRKERVTRLKAERTSGQGALTGCQDPGRNMAAQNPQESMAFQQSDEWLARPKGIVQQALQGRTALPLRPGSPMNAQLQSQGNPVNGYYTSGGGQGPVQLRPPRLPGPQPSSPDSRVSL